MTATDKETVHQVERDTRTVLKYKGRQWIEANTIPTATYDIKHVYNLDLSQLKDLHFVLGEVLTELAAEHDVIGG